MSARGASRPPPPPMPVQLPHLGSDMAAAKLNARVLSRQWAAIYVSVSPVLFDQMVRDGKMPRPRRLSPGRIGWLRHELDAAAEALPSEGGPPEKNEWNED